MVPYQHSESFKGYKENEKHEIRKAKLFAIYPSWGPDFQVSFEITVNKLPTAVWTNVIHCTIGENSGAYGDRNPSVWVNKAGFLYITAAVNGNVNYGYKHYFELKRPHNLTIRQSTTKVGITFYQIMVDGKQVHATMNTKAKAFTKMHVYTSDPWYPGFTSDLGFVKDLQILSGANCLKGLIEQPVIKPNASCKTSCNDD